MAAVDAMNGCYGKGDGASGGNRHGRVAANLGGEAGEKDTAVQDAAGEYAGGQGVRL